MNTATYTALLDELQKNLQTAMRKPPRTTAISWSDRTQNFAKGCTKVSPGCAHCYMYRQASQYGWDPTFVQRTKPGTFNAPLRWPHDGGWVFTDSWSDFWHEDFDADRDDAWDIIRRTPWFRWLILTKRTERIEDHLPADWGDGWPWVGIGTSIENLYWTSRAKILRKIPATMRFISAEPLLGPVDLISILGVCGTCLGSRVNDYYGDRGCPTCYGTGVLTRSPIDWVIVGGESGPDARAMNPAWVERLQQQCLAASVAFHFKQHGEWMDLAQVPGPVVIDTPMHVFPDGNTVVRVGRARAGHLWHGTVQQAMPTWPAWVAHAAELRRRGLLAAEGRP